jgi:hypothetical protein
MKQKIHEAILVLLYTFESETRFKVLVIPLATSISALYIE